MKPLSNEEKIAELHRVDEALAPFTASALCSIIGVEGPDYGELVGTGTYLRYGKALYILTAAHVAQKASSSEYRGCGYSVGPGNRPVLATRPFIIHPNPTLDIAILPVSVDSFVDDSIRPFDASVLAANSVDLADILFVHGYPGERSRFSMFGPGVFSTTLPYGTFLGVSSLSTYDPALHFAIEYRGEGQEDAAGRPATVPDPRGLSGSVVWRAGRANVSGPDWSPQNAEIVGIVHRWDPDCSSLVATRIEPIRSFLTQTASGQS